MSDYLKKHWKLIIPLLIVLAVALGLLQRSGNPYFGQNRRTTINNQPAGQDEFKYFYDKSRELSQQDNNHTTASFLAVGDIMLSRNVAAKIQSSKNIDLPFSRMADILKGVDFSFGNLESPITASGGIIGGHAMIFSAPQEYAKGLSDYKFKALNLANNHALDQGTAGLTSTIKYLDDKNIQHVGAGKNLNDAWQPAVAEANGIKICFVGASYASVNNNGKTTNDYVARIEDMDNLKTAIASAKLQCDFTIATMHAGAEYTRTPNQAQTNFAHAAIDDGADLVIGGHPHWTQTMEKYQGKYIFYSLGNFIFDQEWSQDTKEGLALKIQISKNQVPNQTASGAASLDDLQGSRTPAKLESVELIPVIVENYSTPRPANADETKRILDKIGVTNNLITP
jgi:hypothetical protein